MTSSEAQQLFDQTLFGHYEDDGAWDAVSALRRDGDREIFEIAAQWLKAKEPLNRARAADVLAQLSGFSEQAVQEPNRLFRDEAFVLVAELLESETDSMVLDSGIMALGHLQNEAAIPIIVMFRNHPDRNVRYSVACALGCYPDNASSISALISLTRDEDSDVRDWSVFGLGVLGSGDSSEIRKALLHCLSDPDEDVREEAAVGLGKRQEFNLIPVLRHMLDAPALKSRVAEAASGLLGLCDCPPEWKISHYQDALDERYGPATNH